MKYEYSLEKNLEDYKIVLTNENLLNKFSGYIKVNVKGLIDKRYFVKFFENGDYWYFYFVKFFENEINIDGDLGMAIENNDFKGFQKISRVILKCDDIIRNDIDGKFRTKFVFYKFTDETLFSLMNFLTKYYGFDFKTLDIKVITTKELWDKIRFENKSHLFGDIIKI